MSRRQIVLRALNAVVTLFVAGVVFYVAGYGAGPLPALGPVLNPGTGIWTAARDAQLPHTQTLHLDGLHAAVTVILEQNGTAHISATDDADLFWTIGYLHARFRLLQMDLLRRQGEGLLSEILGPTALDSDRFEDELGLTRTALAAWNALAPYSQVRQGLISYTQGVNARISQDEAKHDLPMMFKLLGYAPRAWTPLDSLVTQGIMTQTLDFTTTPLDYALLVQSLGYQRTMQWFPILPPDAQQPYDPGPYHGASITPLPSQQTLSASAMQAISMLATQIAALPPTAIHHGGNSNNWAVNGTKTLAGKPLMAGDPHLRLTLPAIWYQLEATSPDLYFNGVTIPGIPLILIGQNRHISWSLTDVQNQATLFYIEQTDNTHPGQYYWRGAWRRMQRVAYDIPVKGSQSVHLNVELTVHGPLMPQKNLPGQTIAVDWMGALPALDAESLMQIIHASNFQQFRDALRLWTAPTQNFVYADDTGNIGMVSPGDYPLVQSGAPWLPLPGTGAADIAGFIPFDNLPQVYNPPDHIVFSANQRPVGDTYPYYIGTTQDFFDNGYRAEQILADLRSSSSLTVQDMKRIQTSSHDYLAGLIVPKLLPVLQQAHLSGQEQTAQALLQAWNGDMDANSAAAAIWWTFWSQYLSDTFQPWWDALHVPARQFDSLAVNADQSPLDEDLEQWTLHDPTNPTFSPPDSAKRTANVVMLKAFKESVSQLGKQLGTNPQQWQWGALHSREITSLIQVDALGYGPRASSGDAWTISAADGMVVTDGPSWRFIMDWGSKQGIGIYPGGQDENPLSAWYQNEIASWWNGRYYPMLDSAAARSQAGSVTWVLTP